MFRLGIIYVLFSLASFALFHVIYSGQKIPFAYINILLLYVAIAGSVSPYIFSCALALISWVVLYPFFIFFYKVDALSAALPIVIFNVLQFGFIFYKDMVEGHRKEWDMRLREKENTKKRLLEEFENLDSFEKGMRAKEFAVVNLYEITRKMSESLRFEDIFTVFSVFLKENFTFRKCDLIMLNWDGKEARAERTYSVWRQDAHEANGIINRDRLIKLFLDNPKELYASRDVGDEEFFNAMEIKDENIRTFIGVPLLGEKRMIGILTVENLTREDFERFVILSLQFALEIKKVLLYEIVEQLAITDSLTGLYLRRYFSERLNEEMQRSGRHKLKFSFLMLDIDDFKRCNDAYGHLVGDVVLKDVARVIKEDVREIDIVARYGGEEFSVVLPETDAQTAGLVAERLRSRIENSTFKAYDEKIRVTVSIGISVYPKDSDETRGLIEKADGALYAAKRSGKNVVCIYKR